MPSTPATSSRSMSAAVSPAPPKPPIEESPVGPNQHPLGVLTQEYVSTPFGIGRILWPHAIRTDSIVVVVLEWCIVYAHESEIRRLDNYQPPKPTKMAPSSNTPAKKEKEKEGDDADQQKKKKTSSPTLKDSIQGLIKRKTASSGEKDGANNADGSNGGESGAKKLLDHLHLPDVEFSVLNVPMYRRRQTLALTCSSFFALFCCVFALLLIRASGWIFYAFLAYVTWMLLFQTFHFDGYGLKWEAFRRLTWWKWFRDYFPISLHATAPLDPTGKYIFCYHPHGILSLGAFLNFGSEATGFAEKFPGIDLQLLTLRANFKIPFYGIFLSFMGIADASRESCNNHLQRGPGMAILLVLGGAKESLDAHPHRDYELTLHRKGFVKVALENQADLVPVFSFGENDVWDQVENPRGSALRKLQDRLQRKLGFAFPLVKGRGIFNYTFGLLPHRRPITTFVGSPVILPKVGKEEITDEMINHWHMKYKEALEALFNQYKGTFAPGRKLHFVGEPKGARGSKKTDAENAQAQQAATQSTGTAAVDEQTSESKKDN